MKGIRGKYITFVLGCIISFGAYSIYDLQKGNNAVYAMSTDLSNAKAKIEHLSWSLHNNYLGIKNQGQWQEYIKETREIIKNIPEDESVEKKDMIEFLDKADALVQGLSRINQVEKSIETNFLGIKNARQWNYYIILAENDLSKVNKEEFQREYNELVGRMEQCGKTIEGIETKFESEYRNALNIYFTAESSRDANDAYRAYEKAKELGTCEESDYLENECKMLLVRIGEIKLSSDEKILQESYEKLDLYLQETGISISDSGTSVVKSKVQQVVGNNINVNVNLEFVHPSNGEETYSIVLSKGSAKMHPIVITFGVR